MMHDALPHIRVDVLRHRWPLKQSYQAANDRDGDDDRKCKSVDEAREYDERCNKV